MSGPGRLNIPNTAKCAEMEREHIVMTVVGLPALNSPLNCCSPTKTPISPHALLLLADLEDCILLVLLCRHVGSRKEHPPK